MNIQPIEIIKDDYPILFQDKNLGKAHYSHVKTINPIKVLMEAGWFPREIIIGKTKNPNKQGFQKHRIRFFNPKLYKVNGSLIEILLTNSYDTKSSFILQLGIFRFICSNGIVVGDTYLKESVKHVGYSDQKVFDAISKLIPQTEHILTSVDKFSSVELSNSDKFSMGRSMLEVRFEGDDRWVIDDQTIENLYQTRRIEDDKKDLWTCFNRAQENLCRHGFIASKKNKIGIIKPKKAKAIKSIFRADPLNRAIWNISENMFNEKMGQLGSGC